MDEMKIISSVCWLRCFVLVLKLQSVLDLKLSFHNVYSRKVKNVSCFAFWPETEIVIFAPGAGIRATVLGVSSLRVGPLGLFTNLGTPLGGRHWNYGIFYINVIIYR